MSDLKNVVKHKREEPRDVLYKQHKEQEKKKLPKYKCKLCKAECRGRLGLSLHLRSKRHEKELTPVKAERIVIDTIFGRNQVDNVINKFKRGELKQKDFPIDINKYIRLAGIKPEIDPNANKNSFKSKSDSGSGDASDIHKKHEPMTVREVVAKLIEFDKDALVGVKLVKNEDLEKNEDEYYFLEDFTIILSEVKDKDGDTHNDINTHISEDLENAITVEMVLKYFREYEFVNEDGNLYLNKRKGDYCFDLIRTKKNYPLLVFYNV